MCQGICAGESSKALKETKDRVHLSPNSVYSRDAHKNARIYHIGAWTPDRVPSRGLERPAQASPYLDAYSRNTVVASAPLG